MTSYKQILDELRGADTPLVRWGLVAVILILLWAMVYDPFLGWKAAQLEQLSMRSEKQLKLNGLKDSIEQWRVAKDSYQAEYTGRSRLLFQGGAVVNQGRIQQIVSDLAKKHQLTMINQKSFAPEPESEVGKRLPVSVLLKGNTNDAVRFVSDVSSYHKMLVIDQIRFSRQRKGIMTLTLNLSGFLLESTDE